MRLPETRHSRAIIMIIQCPNCQFAGRIPGYAVDSPYNARCPRCRFRFELHALLADPDVGMHAESEPHGGPGSSSYELKAITDDLAQPDPATSHSDPWGDEQPAVSFNGSGGNGVDPARSAFPAAAVPFDATSPSLDVSEPGREEPWYSRILQVWGIVFLMWAGMIVTHSVLLLLLPGSGTTSRIDVVPSVVSVLLLVPGAATLFLLVELGRYIRGLQAQPPRTMRTTSSSKNPVSLRMRSRSWNRILQAAAPVRS
jgi:hypothetical protein